jgi:GNAT acetyltransferase-like protein
MHLEATSEIDETEYVEFLDGFRANPGAALAYHYPFYLRFLTDVAYPGSATRFIVARDAGGIAGVLPALHVRTAGVNAWLSLAYFGPNAGALVRAAQRDDATARLAAAARDDASDLDCGSMSIYTPIGESADPYLEGLQGVDFDVPRFTQWMRIPDDRGQSPWPRKVRYDIRRARSLGVAVRDVRDVGELARIWEIYRDRCQLRRIPLKPFEHLRRLYATARERAVFLVAEHEGEIIGGLIALIGGGVLSYYLPCTRDDKRSLQPSLALLDAAVEIGRCAGCTRLNFEASPTADGSVFRFKARCGGEPVAYHVLVKLLRPGVLDEYRALSPAGLGRELPQAFLVPFEALTQ